MPTITQLDRGMLLRDIPIVTLDGAPAWLSDFRGRRNVVLIFAGTDAEEARLISELRECKDAVREEEAVAAIFTGADAAIRGCYGALDERDTPAAALYISDRYGEIFFAAHVRRGQPLPSAAEVLEWLRFINSQCPE
jgi:hypothetical protein